MAQDFFGRPCLWLHKNSAFVKPAAGFPLQQAGTCHSAAGISRTAGRVSIKLLTFISSIHYRHTIVPHEEGGGLKNLLHL